VGRYTYTSRATVRAMAQPSSKGAQRSNHRLRPTENCAERTPQHSGWAAASHCVACTAVSLGRRLGAVRGCPLLLSPLSPSGAFNPHLPHTPPRPRPFRSPTVADGRLARLDTHSHPHSHPHPHRLSRTPVAHPIHRCISLLPSVRRLPRDLLLAVYADCSRVGRAAAGRLLQLGDGGPGSPRATSPVHLGSRVLFLFWERRVHPGPPLYFRCVSRVNLMSHVPLI